MSTSSEPPGPEATLAPAGNISAIDRSTVHQICSGQVVLNLATAVKELVENSLDAGATQVEIRLKDYGGTSIEVSDNGQGVEERNFQGLTLKHHTSKLREFEDLISVGTFGFRGEALSSLCALSNVTICTRHKSAEIGATISYDHDGKIIKIEKSARSVGTTVTLENIFSTMPVRLKEFQRTIKKEYARMCQVINSYCLVSTGVRIQCSNTVGKGKRNLVMATRGNLAVKDNIVSLFGTKQLASLKEIQTVDLTEEELVEIGIKTAPDTKIRLSGHVSSCAHGEGRAAPDRQYYYINSRPCDPTRLIKTVNEVYHSYNRHQFPFIFLNVETERTSVDVNITPDKRQVFLQHEKLLCHVVKKSLHALYVDTPCTLPAAQLSMLTPGRSQDADPEELVSDVVSQSSMDLDSSQHRHGEKQSVGGKIAMSFASLKRKFTTESFTKLSNAKAEGIFQATLKRQRTVDSFFKKGDKREGSEKDAGPAGDNFADAKLETSESVELSFKDNEMEDEPEDVKEMPSKSQPGTAIDYGKHVLVFDDFTGSSIMEESPAKSSQQIDLADNEMNKSPSVSTSSDSNKENSLARSNVGGGLQIIFDDFSQPSPRSDKLEGPTLEARGQNGESNSSEFKMIPFEADPTIDRGIKGDMPESNATTNEEEGYQADIRPIKRESSQQEVSIPLVDDDSECRSERTTRHVPFSMDRLRRVLQRKRDKNTAQQQDAGDELRFKARINPEDNSCAEEELNKQISKSDFANMSIFGQFNLGFIIVGLNKDLFIVDQHATDEKYNFETLQKTTEIASQRMVAPLSLELTSVNESVLMENINIFEMNGFKFQINTEAAPTQRIKLTHLPISKNWTFGKEDIDELIFLLSEAPEGTVCRPSRVRAMFASRACRSSVMIGKSLSKGDMRRLVDHMGEIEQPWNCPHGRPTIRHLLNISLASD